MSLENRDVAAAPQVPNILIFMLLAGCNDYKYGKQQKNIEMEMHGYANNGNNWCQRHARQKNHVLRKLYSKLW